MKKALITFGIAILLIAITIPITFFLFKDQIRSLAEIEINKQINGSVTFCDLHLSLLKDFPNLTIVLEDVIVEGNDDFSTDTLASVVEFNIELRTWSLLAGNSIEIKSASLIRPALHFKIGNDGEANYLSIIKKRTVPQTLTKPAPDVSLALDNISLQDGTLIYEDSKNGLYIEVEGLQYSGKADFGNDVFDLKTKTEIKHLTLDYGAVRYLNQKHVEAELIMAVDLTRQKYRLKENYIQINHFRFGMEGSVAVLKDAIDLDLKFRTRETTFENILSLIPGFFMEDVKRIKTKGELTFNGFVKGQYTKDTFPTFLVNVMVSDAMFKIDTLPSPVENINFDLAIKNDYSTTDSLIVDLRNFHLDMMNNPIHGRFKLKGYPEYVIDADIVCDLDLEQLEKMYPISGIEMKGELIGELKASGRYRVSLSHDSLNRQHISEIPSFYTNLKITDGRFKYYHLPRSLDNIQLHLTAGNKTGRLKDTFIDIKSINLDMGKNPIHGYLKVAGYPNYDIDGDLKATIDLADLEQMYPIDSMILKGLLDVDIETKGTYNPENKKFPFIDAVLSLKDGFLKTNDMPEPMNKIYFQGEAKNVTGKLKDTNLSISQLTYTLEDEPFSVNGSLSDFEKYNYDLTIKGIVDLAKISKIYPIDGFHVKGLIDTDLAIQGSVADLEAGLYSKIKSTGKVKIRDLSLRGKTLPQTLRIEEALFSLTPSKIVLEKFKGEFGKSNLSITGDLSNYMAFITRTDDIISGDLKIKCDTLDFNEWSRVAARRAKKAGKQKTNTVQIQSLGVWLVPCDINFTLDSEIGQVNYLDMDISHLNGEIKINDGLLSLHETGFNSLNANFNLSGDYNTRDVLHPLFDFELDIKELDINKAYKEIKLVRDLAPAAEHTFGQLSIDYKLQGELSADMMPKTETLTGGGEIHIAHAQVNGMKIFEEISKATKKKDINDPHLKDLVVKSEIRNNKLFVKPFSIKLSGLNTDIEGVSDVSGAIQYLVQIELVPIEKLRIPFHVTGTYSNPKVSIGKGHKLPQ